MTAKDCLSRLRETEARIEAHAVQLAYLGRLQMRSGQALPPQDEMLRQIHAMKENLRREIDEWTAQRRAVVQAIESMEKPSHRMLLEYRYLCGWDWRRIAWKMHYSLDRIWHLHTEALREFPLPEACQQVLTGER